jgi:hypothetical protein
MMYRIRVFVLPKYFLTILHILRHAVLSEVLLDRACNPVFSHFLSFTLLPHDLFFSSSSNHTVTCQHTARQRLHKHPTIRARNSRTNVYSSLLGNSQRASELAGLRSRDLCFLCDLRHVNSRTVFSALSACSWFRVFSWVPRFLGDWTRHGKKTPEWFEVLVSVLRSVARRRLMKTEDSSECATVNWKCVE